MGSANASLALTIVSVALISCVSTARRTNGDEGSAPILLFNGTGTSAGDVTALENIMRGEHLDYSTSDSAQMNEMSEAQFRKHRLLIVPGGNFEKIGNSLNRGAAASIREAVQNGLNYLGICAGAFFAGNSPYNGLNLTSGSRFGFYSAEARGMRKAPVAITAAGGQTLDQYWEDGPQLTGWGAVVAKYPDGTPAIVEGESGNGWMILAGVHPEAPESWRRGMQFRTAAETDNAYAATLIRAAVSRELMPHY
jgi:glutamine amidotransferase-like uncharacterized protein